MVRSKLGMEPINNAKKRHQTFQTRKTGMIKKALELTTLCDVNVSMIIRTDDDQEPLIFPPDLHKFTSHTDLYRRNRITNPGNIRYYSLSDFFKKKTMKIEEELAMVKKKNLEAKYPTWFDFLNDLSKVQLREFASGLDSKINDVKNKVESLKNISKIQNHQEHYSINPTTTILNDVDQSSSIMPSLNPCHDDDLFFDMEELLGDLNNDENFILDQSSQPQYCFSPEILQQPEPPSFSDQNDLVIMQSSYPDSLMNLPIENDYNYSYNHEHSSLQPTPQGYYVSPEIPHMPELPSFNDQNNFIMQSSYPEYPSVKLQMHMDDLEWCNLENLILQPLSPAYCFAPEILQQPEAQSLGDQSNMIMQSSNQADSMMRKYYIECSIDENFSFQPPSPTYCFQPEIPHHPELPPFRDQNNVSMQSWKPKNNVYQN